MKAIVYTKYGSPDVLALKEVDKPVPAGNEALIKVQAASINSWDYDLLTGTFQGRIGALTKPRSQILGCDIAGTVVAVGQNVKDFKLGDDVFGDTSGFGARDWGGFAEYACAREEILALKSSQMTFEQAAAIPQAAILALQGLRKGNIKSGQPASPAGRNILINGAGGGGGTFAIQIAKSAGVQITGVDSTEKLAAIRSLGADRVIDYTQEDFTKNGQQYDMILDVKTTRSVFDYKRALAPQGIYVTVGGSTPRLLQLALLGPLISGSRKIKLLGHKTNRKDLNILKGLFESGQVKPVIDKCYPLAQTPEAFRHFAQGRFKGKIVITME